MAVGIKLKHSKKRLDYKNAQLLFKTIGTQENELRKRLNRLTNETREVRRAIHAIVKTKLILLKVEL